MDPAVRNRQLFSNHFLQDRLRADPLWSEVASEASVLRVRLRVLLEGQQAALGSANERQTEERWIIPVLREMGWGWEVQPESRRQGTFQYPDFALFPTQEAADAAAGLSERRQVLKRAVGVLEAKRWERSLDERGTAGDRDPNRVPSTQIINYLVRAEQPWGILTNGGEWRLYYRDADFADTVYLAVDLPALLRDQPVLLGETLISPEEAFRYFYLFFRPESFTPAPDRGRWLDLARQASTRYARAVEDALKPRAYRAVTALCRGFIRTADYDATDLIPDSARTREVLDNALTLLFRLLFILYAESRDLLPVRSNAAYRNKSLWELRQRAARARDEDQMFFPKGRDFWSDLHDLFEILDGAPQWRGVGIPIYNGGLFDPEKHPWLEQHYVPDPELAEALDLLSRVVDPETGQLHFVDYSPLDVRHLGSIYEGLLEYVIRIAEESLPEIRESGQIIRDKVPAGAVYLANDKGERKSSGSYYTPDWVVQYIVEQALGPLVAERTAEEILRLAVLDPAMGSGHFLVAATSFLTRAATHAAAEGPQTLLGTFAELDPDHLRRLVVERCIYGVDKNARAVELAKLALWLATVQRDKPLNFLDHHLRHGDSLLGARVEQMRSLPKGRGRAVHAESEGQYSIFEGAFRLALFQVLGFLDQIRTVPSETETDIKKKEGLYREAEALLARFRMVANVWASAAFGNEAPIERADGKVVDALADRFAQATEMIRAPAAEWDALCGEPWFRRAQEAADEQDFFHWEIEFPEVFYEENGSEQENPGFDAVIGNPPYLRMEEFSEIKDFLRPVYRAHQTRADLYIYFMERSLDLLREGGEYGVIVRNKFLRAKYGAPIRRIVGEIAQVREITDFGELPVFEDAAAEPAIVLVAKDPTAGEGRFAQIPALEFADLEEEIARRAFPLAPEAAQGEEWRLVPAHVARVMELMECSGVSLVEYTNGQIARGIVPGREHFYITAETRANLIAQDPQSEAVIKPLVVGDDIRRYRIEGEQEYILYLPHGVEIARFPAVEEYLRPYRESLENRATNQEWYELQQPQKGYVPIFEGPKILYPEMALESRFCWHPGPLYPNNKCFCVPGSDFFLLGVLNSRAAFFYLAQTCSVLGDAAQRGRLELRASYLKRLPVPKVPAEDSEERRSAASRFANLYSEAAVQEPTPDPTAILEAANGLLTIEAGRGAVADFVGTLAGRLSELYPARQRETHDFLGWLEEQIGASIDDLTGKTRVSNYSEHSGEDLLDVLQRNYPRRVVEDLSPAQEYGETNEARARIIRGYARSMKRLGPVKREIAFAEGLVDALVYRLYGLGPGEIETVEAGP